MERSKSNLPVLAMLVIIGLGAIIRFSQGVRIVQVIGLSGGGAACGAALVGFIWAFKTRVKG